LADLVLGCEDDTEVSTSLRLVVGMLEQEASEAVAELDIGESRIELVDFVGAVDRLSGC